MRRLAAGALPTFPSETAAVRKAAWTVAPAAAGRDLQTIRLQGLDGYAAVAEQIRDVEDGKAVAGPGEVGVEVVVDTIWSAFEVEEILYELRTFAASVRASPLGYLCSFIQVFSERPEFVLPDRADIIATTPCIDAYYRHLGDVCARRGAVFSGAPDRQRRVFDDDRPVEPADLLQVPKGRITEPGVRASIEIALKYLSGDAKVERVEAEFARAQLWQWFHHETGVLDTGRIISPEVFSNWLAEARDELAASTAGRDPDPQRVGVAAARLAALTAADSIPVSIDAEGYLGDA